MEEIWKDIEGYEGLYQVSNTGKVRSLNYGRTGKVKELVPTPTRNGYLQVTLCENGEKKPFRVHRLVAQAFLPNPDNLPVINHLDEVKHNNHVSNLEWTTQKENLLYSNVGWSGRPVMQFTKSGLAIIREYKSAREASRHTGVYQSDISSCCSGKLKSAGGYVWRYKN